MNELPTPTLTAVARRWLDREVPQLDRTQQALLSTVDGHRNVIQLESVARAMRLPDRTLEEMRERGLLVWSTLERNDPVVTGLACFGDAEGPGPLPRVMRDGCWPA